MQIMKARLEEHYPILYTGETGRAAHEMIVEFQRKGIEVVDIAKRLMDYTMLQRFPFQLLEL
jgi:glycine dehydrogenase